MRKSKLRKKLNPDSFWEHYYGLPAHTHPYHSGKHREASKNDHPKSSVSMSFDNGEVLQQQPASANSGSAEEYVVVQSLGDFTEYVATGDISTNQPITSQQEIAAAIAQSFSTPEEYTIDILHPVDQTPAQTFSQEEINPVALSLETFDAERIAQADGPMSKLKKGLSDDDLIADMQSILGGGSVFDPNTKKVVKKEEAAALPPAKQQAAEPTKAFGNGHAIFDEIAKSMQYANAYDLGAVELDNRFSNFDEVFDVEEKVKAAKKQTKQTSVAQSADDDASASNADFIRDLDDIRKQAAARAAVGESGSQSTAANGSPAGSEPIFSTEKTVIGQDERRIVSDAKAVPYRWICKIEPTFTHPDDHSREISFTPGTGLLLGPRHILTAAHVIETNLKVRRGAQTPLEDVWQRAIKVRVTPGANGENDAPFGNYTATVFHILPEWSNGKNENNRHYDYAVIVLDEDIAFKTFASLGNKRLGHWGHHDDGANTHMSSFVPQMIKDITLDTAGYPHDAAAMPRGKLWTSRGTMQDLPNDAPAFLHTMDTEVGQSGSPIWKTDPKTGERLLIGIHVAGFTSTDGKIMNMAVMLTSPVASQVVKWMA